MYAMKVMTRPVVTVPADATVWAAADILLGVAHQRGAGGRCRRQHDRHRQRGRPDEPARDRHRAGRSWLQRLLTDEAVLARDYMRSHSHHVADVMTRDVMAADERTELEEIASLMQRHGIKRVPIVRDGKVGGHRQPRQPAAGPARPRAASGRGRRQTRQCAPGCPANWTGIPGVPASATSWSRTASSTCGATPPRRRQRMPSGWPSRTFPA